MTRRSLPAVKAVVSVCLGALGVWTLGGDLGTATASEYHVAVGPCGHGSNSGSDSNNGLSRQNAFLTVQRCLDVMTGGDTCTIHTGTYVGDFDCCGNGDSSIEPVTGSASSPTRILGATGDTVVLEGTPNQTHPVGATNAYSTGIGTLTIKADSYGDYSRWVEVGNLTIQPGAGPALSMPRVHDYWVHDLTVTDLSMYSPPLECNGAGSPPTCLPGGGEPCALESTGIIWLWRAQDGLAESVTIDNSDNSNTTVVGHPFHFAGSANKIRNADLADFQGAINQGHGGDALTYEFIRVRNHIPYYCDDGGIIHLYNNSATVVRYVSTIEASHAGDIVWYGIGARRSEGETNGNDCDNSDGPNQVYMINNTFEGDGNPDDNAIGAAQWDKRGFLRCINDWRAYNNLLKGWDDAIVFLDNPASGLDDNCDMTTFAHNAYSDIDGNIVSGGSGLCNYDSRAEAGRMTCNDAGSGCTDAELKISDHVPNDATSPLVNAGSAATFGGTPWFPVPEGGGVTADIGAYERGAGPWPYEFQTIATVNKDPATETIRVCWDSGLTGCDVTIPLWDPGTPHADNNSFSYGSARPAPLTHYQIQIDPSNSFANGNASVAAGFGAFYDTTASPSPYVKFHDVPAGTLGNGQNYYVQVRVGGTNSDWNCQTVDAGPCNLATNMCALGASWCSQNSHCTNNCVTNNGFGNNGWGPWSVAFYRFRVEGQGSGTPPGVVQNARRNDTM